MAAMNKLTVLALVVCFVCLVVVSEAKERPSHGQDKSPGNHQGHQGHHFVKRDADDYQDGDEDFQRPEYNSFDRPHKIRVLPGFLH